VKDLAPLYDMLYRDPAHATYGRGLSRCEPFLPRIWSSGLDSVISFGCGSGDELIAISGTVPHCLGIDFGLPGIMWYALTGRTLGRIQVAMQDFDVDSTWDAVVSFDVLEHLPEDDLDGVLAKMVKLAPARACLVVADMPDVHDLPDGRQVDLHLIRQPAAWWVERIHRVTGWPVEVKSLRDPQRFGLWCGEWP
jgi:hypothetical protein